MPFKRLIEGGLNLYEEVHPKNVREAINILDRFFLYQRSFDDTASEAWKLIRANLKEARMMSILDEYSFPTYLEDSGFKHFANLELARGLSNYIVKQYENSIKSSKVDYITDTHKLELSLYTLDPYADMSRIVNNGRCTKCGKELDNNRLFLCEDCSKLQAQEGKSNDA